MTGWMEVWSGVHMIGWMLMHSLWQGTLIGAAYGVARWLLPRGVARYRLGMASLVVLALLPLLTYWRLSSVLSLTASPMFAVVLANSNIPVVALRANNWTGISVLEALQPWIVLLWLLGVGLLSFRAWRQWRKLRAVVRKARVVPRWQHQIGMLIERLGLRRQVTVLCSSEILAPALVGWIRPVILLPMAVACNFPVNQVELILAHELAHLRRCDPLANLFQILLETVLFYHPVVHWISREVRNEREICCDSLALSVSGRSRLEFVEALADLGDLKERYASIVLAANGGVLLDRVQYMVRPRHQARRRAPHRIVPIVLGMLMIAFALRLEWNHQHTRSALQDVSAALPSLGASIAMAIRQSPAPVLNPGVAEFLPRLTHYHPLRAALPAIAAETVAELKPVKALPIPAPIAVVQSKPLPIPPIVVAQVRTNPAPKPASETMSRVLSAAGLTLVRTKQPSYPQAALMDGVEGRVVVEFALAGDGALQELRVVQSEPSGLFDEAALRAMREWKYRAPPITGEQRRYRQELMFVLSAARGGKHGPSATGAGSDRNRAHADCQVATGTHICRRPGNGA